MIHKITIKDERGYGVSYVTRRMLTEIIRLRNQYYIDNGFLFDHIYMSPVLANFFYDYKGFLVNPVSNIDETTQFIGTLNEMKIFIDLEIDRNHIKLSIDQAQLREVKIDSILDKINPKLTEAIIEIESDLI